MRPSTVDISRVRGDDYPIQVLLTDSLGPLDVRGVDFVFQLDVSEHGDLTKTLAKYAGGGGPGGVAEIPVPPDLAGRAPGTYQYSLKMLGPTGKRTVATGTYEVIEDKAG